jgi:site-specific recombinase XerD
MDTQKMSVPGRLAFDTSILAGQLAQSSIDMYKRDFAAYLYFAGTPDAALDAATLARWRTALANDTQMSPNTINRMLSAVKRLMKEAASQGYATHEVAASFEQVKGVKVAAMKERTKTTAQTRIAPEVMRSLTSTPDITTLVGKRDAALLHTLASSGLRVSELASLTLTQVIKSGGGYLLRILGKNDVEYRDAHLSPTAYKAIQKWIQARPVMSHYIFTSLAGRGESRATDKPMSEVAVWQTIKKYADQAGLENVKPHDLRRFVGTQLAKKDIRKAQKALGHKRIDTTARHYVLDELEVGLTDNLY